MAQRPGRHHAQSQRDVRNRIASVKNIEKITRAMEMVAAARLRRAEQRIEALRPYADAIRRMTRQAAAGAPAPSRSCRSSPSTTEVRTVGLLLSPATAASPARSTRNIVRAGVAAGREHDGDGPHASSTSPPAGGRPRR